MRNIIYGYAIVYPETGNTVKDLCVRLNYANYTSASSHINFILHKFFIAPYVTMHKTLEHIKKKIHEFIKRPVFDKFA